MTARAQALSNLFQARLSRRIVWWVFASIVVIEAIILIPSVYRREQELLTYLEELAAARATGILSAADDSTLTDAELLESLQQIQQMPAVVGGVLYDVEGNQVGSFGEPPMLEFADLQRRTTYLNRRRNRYDALWSMSPLDGRYLLVIRHDTASVEREVYQFIGRIAGLVLIISVFVTVATLAVLEPLLITPILTLRQDLLRAGEAARQDQPPPEFKSLRFRRRDELGEVIAAFELMFQQVTAAIAERKQAETKLRLSEEKFSKAFRSSPNPIVISALTDGRILEVNDSFLNLYRGLRQDVINRTSNELNLWVDPRDRNQMTQTLRTEGFVFNQEYQFQNRFGDRKTVLFSAETIILDGQTCILSVVNDITERKQAEEALRESEGRFHALVEQAADAFFVVDAAGKILDVNQQACRNLGYDHEELLTLSVLDIQQDVPMTDLAELWQQLQPGAPITVTGTHRRKDGSLFPVEVRIGLFEVSGQQYILALARDVTERKQAEQALERLAEIGELAAMIVHEVRNPLTTVWMGLNSFKSLELSPRSQARLNLALEESERLQRLLNEILLYARQQTLDLQPVELVAWITDLLPALQEMPSACDRPIQFSSKSEAAWIRADTDKLKQVFINLISNACEAISPQEQVIWTVQTTNRQAHIQIYNSGDPIPADLLAKLTQPFFTTKSSGNGLGLAITKRIVEAHGGEFAIASSAALQGTQVTVYLPLTDPEA